MNEKFMLEALKQAKIAYDKGDVPVGAIIVKDNKVIARAYNRREETKDVTNHAEIIAIKKACRKLNDWRLNGCYIYVTLEPCPMCAGAIEQARIDRIIYGASNLKDIDNHFSKIEGGILELECTQILKSFFQKRRNC